MRSACECTNDNLQHVQKTELSGLDHQTMQACEHAWLRRLLHLTSYTDFVEVWDVFAVIHVNYTQVLLLFQSLLSV